MTTDAAEARLAARLECVLHTAERTNDLTALEALLAEAGDADAPAVSPHLALSIECNLEDLRSRARQVAQSIAVWEELRGRAEAVLGPGDTTLMSIRSFQTQYVRRRGLPEDLDAGCRGYEEELDLRTRYLGETDYRTRVARANWALALRDRNGPGDLARAVRVLEEEMDYRLNTYGGAHPFTWDVQTVLAQTLLRVAEASDPPARRDHAVKALEMIRPVATHRRKRFGWTDAATLRAQLVEANALMELGGAPDAVAEIRHVRTAVDVAGVKLDAGWPEFLLAAALAELGEAAALDMAERSLALREQRYPSGSRLVIQSQTLLAELRRRFAE